MENRRDDQDTTHFNKIPCIGIFMSIAPINEKNRYDY